MYLSLLDLLTIEESSIGRTQVTHDQRFAPQNEFAMHGRDRGVINGNVVVSASSNAVGS